MLKCQVCSSPLEEAYRGGMCGACAMELAYRILGDDPDPAMRECTVCGAEFRYTEARVLRQAKNHKGGNATTPHLCWVCSHLYYSARKNNEAIPFLA